jgi:DNA-binding NarL/FixJ family response regulator
LIPAQGLSIAYRGRSLIFLKFFSKCGRHIWYKACGGDPFYEGSAEIKIATRLGSSQLVFERLPGFARKDSTQQELVAMKSLIASPTQLKTRARVLIVHHTPLVRSGLVALIEAAGRFAVCGETDDVPTGREMFVKNQPRVVVLGLTLRRGNGIELIKDFRRLNRVARVLVVSARDDPLSIQRAFRAGTHGYLVLEDNSSEVLHAIERISDGHLYASASVMRRLLESLATNQIEPARSELKSLSDRELQVFSLIGRGFGASRLATELHLSVKTIETYQAHIKQKLGLHSAAELSEKAAHWTLHSMRRNLQLKKFIKTAA